jgi:hypothetical protein
MAIYYVRTDGNDSNTGLGSTTSLAWATIAKVFSASGMASGDTVYIAPGHYAENIISSTLTPTVATFIIGDPTASQFAGVTAGVVKLSGFTAAGNAAPTLTNSLITLNSKNHLKFSNLYFESGAGGTSVVCTTGHSWSFTNCVFDMCSSYSSFSASTPTSTAGNFTFSKCIFFNGCNTRTIQITGQGVADTTSISDCLFLGSGGSECVYSLNCQMTITNCTFAGVNVGVQTATGNVLFPSYVSNCLFAVNSIALLNSSSTLVWMTENYNRILGNAVRLNMGTLGANSTTGGSYRISLGYEKMHGLVATDFFAPIPNSPNQAFGTTTNAPTSDLYGRNWNVVRPDAGALTYVANVTPYIPLEINQQSININGGSTSRSLYIYLGSTALTTTTAGLQSYYTKEDGIPVSIPLVAQTPTGAWVAGGFAEVSAINQPGIYRLDIPDAAISAGYNQTVVTVRGASGTNGAVVTIQDPPERGSAIYMGPYKLISNHMGADNPLEVLKGVQAPVDLQLVDNSGGGVDITGSTVTAKIYNASSQLIDTYTCTPTYALDGRCSFNLDTTVTDNSGHYTVTVTRQVGGNIVVFGPLRCLVRAN